MQRYFGLKKEGEYLYLDENDLYHIKTVMRMKENDLVEIVYDNHVYISSLKNINKNIKFKIEKIEDTTNSIKPYVTLIIPVLKERKLDLIFQKGTELGVDEFILCPMTRCMVKLENKKTDSKLLRWLNICKEASEQSKRVSIPSVKIVSNFNEIYSLPGVNFTCSTQEKYNNIKKTLKSLKNCDRINLVIGPEGGLTPLEETCLEENNFEKITLGNQIMRVETVPLFLMSIINYEYME